MAPTVQRRPLLLVFISLEAGLEVDHDLREQVVAAASTGQHPGRTAAKKLANRLGPDAAKHRDDLFNTRFGVEEGFEVGNGHGGLLPHSSWNHLELVSSYFLLFLV